MGTTRTLAAGEAFVEGRSRDNAAKLVTAAAELDLKGSVRTTYDGYIAPSEVVEAAGFEVPETKSAPENPADHSEEPANEFDPSKATVDEVIEYLENTDKAEVERVLAAEAAGKNRKGVTEYTITEEGK